MEYRKNGEEAIVLTAENFPETLEIIPQTQEA